MVQIELPESSSARGIPKIIHHIVARVMVMIYVRVRVRVRVRARVRKRCKVKGLGFKIKLIKHEILLEHIKFESSQSS